MDEKPIYLIVDKAAQRHLCVLGWVILAGVVAVAAWVDYEVGRKLSQGRDEIAAKFRTCPDSFSYQHN